MRLLALLAVAGAAVLLAKRRHRPHLHPDERLGQQVRAQIAALLADPRAVRVTVNRGVIGLRGSVSKAERDDVLAAVLATPGVTQVSNFLEVAAPVAERPEEQVGLQGTQPRGMSHPR
jgi:hypothetical protein